MKLIPNIYYLLLIFIIIPNIGIFGQDTFADNFDSQNYNLNNGSSTWSTPWIEENDSPNGNPDDGFIFIFLVGSGELTFNFLFTDLENIRRTVDLSTYSTATLSFD